MSRKKVVRSDNPKNWDREVSADIKQIHNILSTKILDNYQRDPHALTLAKCAFTQLMIPLKDLLTKANAEGKRLDVKVNDEFDVTDIVCRLRDAACHITSNSNFIDKSTLVFGMQTLPNDDISYSYGTFKIAFNGAVVPIFNEVKKRLIPLTDLPPHFFE